jgi:hypothetical protein
MAGSTLSGSYNIGNGFLRVQTMRGIVFCQYIKKINDKHTLSFNALVLPNGNNKEIITYHSGVQRTIPMV